MADLSNAGINMQKKGSLCKYLYNISSLFSFSTVTLQPWKTLIIFSKILIKAFRSLMLSLGLVLCLSAKKLHYLGMQSCCQFNILWAVWDLDACYKQSWKPRAKVYNMNILQRYLWYCENFISPLSQETLVTLVKLVLLSCQNLPGTNI